MRPYHLPIPQSGTERRAADPTFRISGFLENALERRPWLLFRTRGGRKRVVRTIPEKNNALAALAKCRDNEGQDPLRRLWGCARRKSGGQGIFLGLLHASERTGTQGQRPRGPKELSPGRQPWVQKALWLAAAPAGRKNKVAARELSLVLLPLAGLARRLGLVSQGPRPGLSSIARQPTGSPDHPAAATVSSHEYVMQHRQDSHFYIAHPDCGSCLHLLARLRTLRGDFFRVEAQLIP